MGLRSNQCKFRRGDLVQVRREAQIQATLDAQGRLEGLPWMPEMRAFCGRTFRVYRRAEKVFLDHHCYVGRLPNTVLLDAVRCSGADHGGCQMGCLLLWKEDWLRPAPAGAVAEDPAADELDALADTCSRTPVQRGATLAEARRTSPLSRTGKPRPVEEPAPVEKTAGHERGALCVAAWPVTRLAEQVAAGPFSCQATELVHATERWPWWRPGQYLADLSSGEMGLRDFARMLLLQTYNKLQRFWGGRRFGDPRGCRPRTPRKTLDLQPGEWVEVKSLPEILATLDHLGRNRGLGFGPEMARFCGRRLRVARRVERLIVEWTGELRTLSDTVALEGAICDGLAFRGCPRACYHLWREIWLRRVKPPSFAEAARTAKWLGPG